MTPSDSNSENIASSTTTASHLPGSRRQYRWFLAFFLLNTVGLATLIALQYMHTQRANTITLLRATPSQLMDEKPFDVDPQSVSGISLEWSGPLEKPTSEADIAQLITLSPPVPGYTEFINDRTLRYVLSEPLARSTRYVVKIDHSLRSAKGVALQEKTWSFSTPALAVQSLSYNGMVERGLTLNMFFSSPVHPDALREHLSITRPDGSSAPWQVSGGLPNTMLSCKILQLDHDTLKLTIRKGLTGVDGPLGLTEDFQTLLRMELSEQADQGGSQAPSPPGVLLIRRNVAFTGMDASWENGTGTITIHSNTSLDAGRAKEFLRIEPEIPFGVESRWNGLRLSGDFEAGKRYRVTLLKGLPAGEAGCIADDVTRSVWFPEAPPSIGFAFGGGYLSPVGLLTVPVETVNMTKADLRIYRLYSSNVVEHVLDGTNNLHASKTTLLKKSHLTFSGERNTPVQTLLRLRELLHDEPIGVYRLTVYNDERYDWHDSAVVVVTDLGLSTRLSDTHVLCWTTSLASGMPKENVKVQLYSDRRQLIGEALSSSDGLAEIIIPPLPTGEHPAMILATSGEDMSYLSFDESSILRGEETSGKRGYLTSGYEGFLTPERGVYRPGDTAHISGLVRGMKLTTPPSIPLDLVVRRPDGQVLIIRRVMSDTEGRVRADISLPESSPPGYYAMRLFIPGNKSVHNNNHGNSNEENCESDSDENSCGTENGWENSIGDSGFRVADYIPQTLAVTLSAPQGPIARDSAFSIKVFGKHLFGEPAKSLDVTCSALFEPFHETPKDWENYTFGDARVTGQSRHVSLPKDMLNGKGETTFQISAPAMKVPDVIQATFTVDVREKGGRAVTETLVRRLDPHPFRLGIQQPDTSLTVLTPANFSLIAVNSADKLWQQQTYWKATWYAVTYSHVLRRSGNGRLVYDWVRDEKKESESVGSLIEGCAQVTFTPAQPGSYRVVIEAEGGGSVTADVRVIGAGGSWVEHDPDQIKILPDRTNYQPGEEAVCTLQSPFAGKALVCIESDHISEQRVVTLVEGKNELRFHVTEAWRPNVYVTATVIRPVQAEDDWRPHRASGVARLTVDCSEKNLTLQLDAPATIRPGQACNMKVCVLDALGQPVPNAAVTVAAVDEGVLALTKFHTSSPFDFFYATRRLDIREMDMFDRLAPELAAWRADSTPRPGGGDDPIRDAGRHLNPIAAKRVRSAVLYAGEVVTDETGMASIVVTIPEYLGSMRWMIWAASDDRFGSIEQPMTIRSPIMFRASWPRFLAPGDVFDVPMTVFNQTKTGGRINIKLMHDELLEMQGPPPAPISLSAGEETHISIRLKARSVGKTNARLTINMGEDTYGESIELPIRPAASYARSGGSVIVTADTPATITLPDGFLPNTARGQVLASGHPVAAITGSLQMLLKYPHGCLEQTTSRMIPLIYAPDLAAMSQPESVGKEEVAHLLESGFTRLRTMQTYNGGLAMWPNERDPYPWGSLYACDMLLEARAAGYDVPESLLDPLIQYVERNLPQWMAKKHPEGTPSQTAESAYACYVLTRAGRRPGASLSGLEERIRLANAGKRFAGIIPASARCHVAAAYFLLGEKELAASFLHYNNSKEMTRNLGASLSSPIRDRALLLSTLLDIDPESDIIPNLINRLHVSLKEPWAATTQENAFALMALGKYARRISINTHGRVRLTLPGNTGISGPLTSGGGLADIGPGQTVTVSVEGTGTAFATWSMEGIPANGTVKEEDTGISVRRLITTTAGEVVDPDALQQGELYHIILRVTSPHRLENGLITCLLPAGLEIESNTIDPAHRPIVHGTPETYNNRNAIISPLTSMHLEAHDDRLLIFGDLPDGISEHRFLVRAVTVGTFALPAVEASCQYDPARHSAHGAGHITVVVP